MTDELVEAFLNGNEEFPYYLNIETKEIDLGDGEEADSLVQIPQMTSSEAYNLMMDFAKKQEAEVSQQLIDALNRRKPFRSFKDQIKGLEVEQAWYDFENEYAKKEMTAWIENIHL